jgi:hypothetical protein
MSEIKLSLPAICHEPLEIVHAKQRSEPLA